MEVVTPIKEASDAIREAGGGIFDLCFQCDLCTVSCPWNTVRTFLPHKVIRQSQFGLIDLEDEWYWLCTTCNMCVSRCPRGVSPIDIMVALRAYIGRRRTRTNNHEGCIRGRVYTGQSLGQGPEQEVGVGNRSRNKGFHPGRQSRHITFCGLCPVL